jgi:hypothetical protein
MGGLVNDRQGDEVARMLALDGACRRAGTRRNLALAAAVAIAAPLGWNALRPFLSADAGRLLAFVCLLACAAAALLALHERMLWRRWLHEADRFRPPAAGRRPPRDEA